MSIALPANLFMINSISIGFCSAISTEVNDCFSKHHLYDVYLNNHVYKVKIGYCSQDLSLLFLA